MQTETIMQKPSEHCKATASNRTIWISKKNCKPKAVKFEAWSVKKNYAKPTVFQQNKAED